MLGSDLLVQPITAKTCEQTQVYLPGPADRPTEDALWYALHTYPYQYPYPYPYPYP